MRAHALEPSQQERSCRRVWHVGGVRRAGETVELQRGCAVDGDVPPRREQPIDARSGLPQLHERRGGIDQRIDFVEDDDGATRPQGLNRQVQRASPWHQRDPEGDTQCLTDVVEVVRADERRDRRTVVALRADPMGGGDGEARLAHPACADDGDDGAGRRKRVGDERYLVGAPDQPSRRRCPVRADHVRQRGASAVGGAVWGVVLVGPAESDAAPSPTAAVRVAGCGSTPSSLRRVASNAW